MNPSDYKKSLWTGIAAATKKKISHVSATRDTEGEVPKWSEYVGQHIPPVFTTVPVSEVKDPAAMEEARKSALLLLGNDCVATFYLDEAKAPTGEVLIKFGQLT